jgi:hypothetical protein
MVGNPGGKGSPAQKLYYLTILVPMWRAHLDRLAIAQRDYRYHLLAVECLRVAKGPGADPLRLAEFCRAWQTPLTAPAVGPVALLRSAAKAVGGWPSAGAVFDPTGAIGMGVKVLARMGPLIGQIQMRNALLVALDDKVVARADQSAVGSILERSHTPQLLLGKVKESKATLERLWGEAVQFAKQMETAQRELGLPDSAM